MIGWARATAGRMRAMTWVAWWLASVGALLAPWSASHAGALRYCDAPAELSAVQQDRLLRFGTPEGRIGP